MILDEGKNREIRRMLARLGHKVHQLKRVGVGKLSLGNLLPSQWRQLAWNEIEALRHDAIAAVGPLEAERMNEPAREERRPPRPGRESASGRGPAGRPRMPRAGQGPEQQPRRPAGRGPRRPRKPGKASSWRKPRGE